MKRILLNGFALMAFFTMKAQTEQDSTAYKNRKLKIDEINLVSSYYKQDGNNSAVTGGIGTEELTDISTALDVRLVKYGETGKKHTFDLELGVDHYSSASSDRIDLAANSSASSADIRVYPSILYSLENEEKGSTFTAGVSSSTEFDYQSFGGTIGYARKTKDRNGEFSARLQTFLDQVKLIQPIELRTGGDGYGTDSRNTFALSLGYTQVVNKNLQVALIADLVTQQGYLALPFHRVYFTDGSVHQELLPDSRFKIPIGVRVNYFVGDNIIFRAYYRYYSDDWGLTAHTASLEVPVKLTQALSISPFYRYYGQSAVKYFAGYQQHTGSEEFYTSNYDLSKFNSGFYGMGVKFTPPGGVFGIEKFNTIELRYGHYESDNARNLVSDIISLNIKVK